VGVVDLMGVLDTQIKRSKMKMSYKPLLAAAVSVVSLLAVSSSALAAAPTGIYRDFKYCPYTNANVNSCVYSKTTSGSFKLGNTTVPITSSTPLVLQGGYHGNDDGTEDWYNAVGADTLVKTPLKVPGGLIGLVDTGGWSGLLISLFNAAVASVNDVYATAELAGPVRFNLGNALLGTGEAVGLPVRIHLTNPFLGSNCYIGSTSNPVNLSLTTGTTSPPAGTAPITGVVGTTTFSSDFGVITQSGLSLVDNRFAVPAATDCGYLPLDKLLITAGVNLREGFPAAAGRNVAVLSGTTEVGSAANTAASVQ
jgi:hypothetical protein